MSRSQLRIAAALLIVLIVVVAANALDHLPGSVRGHIDAERAALVTSQSQLGAARSQVADQVQAAPDLFDALPFGREWADRFGQAAGQLRSAADDVDQLTRIEKRDRRADRQQVETLLSHEGKLRAQALADATAIQKDAAHWVDAGNHLPEQIPEMERTYQAIHGFDLGPDERRDLIAFLESLTDKAFLTDPALSDPFAAAP